MPVKNTAAAKPKPKTAAKPKTKAKATAKKTAAKKPAAKKRERPAKKRVMEFFPEGRGPVVNHEPID